jgi:hypothetical protein
VYPTESGGGAGRYFGRTFLAKGFFVFILIFNNFQNSIAIHAQIHLITKSFGCRPAVGGSYAGFV